MCRIPVKPQTPIDYYYKSSQELLDQADVHYRYGRLEESFILYSRYIILHAEGLRKLHPNYSLVSNIEKNHVNEVIKTRAFPRAEELKKKLQDKYEQNISLSSDELKRVESSDVSENSTFTKGANNHNENDVVPQKIKSNYVDSQPGLITKNMSVVPATDNVQFQIRKEPQVDRSTKPNYSNLISYRRVVIPSDITTTFLNVAQQNTTRNIETCGVLAGSKTDNNQYIITHIVVPKQNGGPDSCDTEKEEEMVEYITSNDLITLGWIHTHPSQTAFLSSVDLHTHLSYQITGIFSLTNDRGIPVLSTCNKTGFHEHANNPPLYQLVVCQRNHKFNVNGEYSCHVSTIYQSKIQWHFLSSGRTMHVNILASSEGRMGYPSEKYEPTTITALDKEEDKNIKPLISGLYNDGFQLNNEIRIVGAVFAFPRQFICWNVFEPEDMTPESLSILSVIEPKPDIFILGIGSPNNQLPKETIKYLKDLRIGFEILPTTQAVETYNFLLNDDRLVYGAFFPEKDIKDSMYGLRQAIAKSQYYESTEDYTKGESLSDSLRNVVETYRASKLGSDKKYIQSPLMGKNSTDENESQINISNSEVKSLTGTSVKEKRATKKLTNNDEINKA
ncbi:unnamed protein product [Didymodactylos carnosus]|uniref:MPN domain-containing protein n=1 Tax=Didymodactylos carnosus TaxID=1234261 RepID=A0A814F1Q8_9BILA|nr:unnamed protein product [Didymodactylos carnosus]CAF1020479.1 unnamed protein product [Didymodactylos carnosus]CAF3748340.1 unnamed protein product [Didymodactylos carnosus]CAF3789147.1 unnamed protein product [Didymodactylos carnosus]